jgi:hypothetical protein
LEISFGYGWRVSVLEAGCAGVVAEIFSTSVPIRLQKIKSIGVLIRRTSMSGIRFNPESIRGVVVSMIQDAKSSP